MSHTSLYSPATEHHHTLANTHPTEGRRLSWPGNRACRVLLVVVHPCIVTRRFIATWSVQSAARVRVCVTTRAARRRSPRALVFDDTTRPLWCRSRGITSTFCCVGNLASGQSNLTKRPHRCRTWTVQSYSPGGANVHPYLIDAFLGPLESTSQTASPLVQPFCHGSLLGHTDRLGL